jgi:hypothetical protein
VGAPSAIEERAAVEVRRARAAALAEAVDDEIARRSFHGWARKRFHILNKHERDELLKLNRAQLLVEAAETRMLAEQRRARLITLKGRQGGITTWAQAKNLHVVLEEYGAGALTIAHDRDGTDKIFEKVTSYAVRRFDQSKLPVLGEKHVREITVPELASSFYTGTAGSARTGLGLTMRRLHGSEFAMWDKPKASLRAVAPALNRDGTTIILETTASGFDTEAHHFYRAARDGKNRYRALFIPWWLCDPETYQRALAAPDELGTLEPDEQELRARHGLKLEELKWRREMISELGGKDEFLQQYPEDDESCWLAAGGMWFSAEKLKLLQLKSPKPIRTEEVQCGDFTAQVEIFAEAAGEEVIIGSDTSEGVGQDSSTFTARTRGTWRLLRKFKHNRIEPVPFAILLNNQGRALGNAFLVVEKNLHGITVLRELRDVHHYPIACIYHRPVLDRADNDQGLNIGWATTGESKPAMLDAGRELLGAALKGVAGVPAEGTIRDAFAVRRGEDGKYDLNGKDELVAEMLAWVGRTAPTTTGFLDHLRAKAAAQPAPKKPV